MTLSDIKFEMELIGVDKEDMESIIQLSKKHGILVDLINDELVKRGYEKLFSDEDDEENEWDDGEYASVEKFPSRNNWSD